MGGDAGAGFISGKEAKRLKRNDTPDFMIYNFVIISAFSLISTEAKHVSMWRKSQTVINKNKLDIKQKNTQTNTQTHTN